MEHRRHGRGRRCAGRRSREALIPALPNDVALLCLHKIPPPMQLPLRCVSKAWKRAIRQPETPRLLVCLFPRFVGPSVLASWYVFDPVSRTWQHIPHPFPLPHVPLSIPDDSLLWRTWPGRSHDIKAISLCGPYTYCLKATQIPLLYGGAVTSYFWQCAPRMIEEDRWKYLIKETSDGQFVYVLGGWSESKQLFLRSAERFNIEKVRWESLPSMQFVPDDEAHLEMLGKFCFRIVPTFQIPEDDLPSSVYDPATGYMVPCPLHLLLGSEPMCVSIKGQTYHIEFITDLNFTHVAVLKCQGNSIGLVPIPATSDLFGIRLTSMGDKIVVIYEYSFLFTSPLHRPLRWTHWRLPFNNYQIQSHVVFGV